MNLESAVALLNASATTPNTASAVKAFRAAFSQVWTESYTLEQFLTALKEGLPDFLRRFPAQFRKNSSFDRIYTVLRELLGSEQVRQELGEEQVNAFLVAFKSLWRPAMLQEVAFRNNHHGNVIVLRDGEDDDDEDDEESEDFSHTVVADVDPKADVGLVQENEALRSRLALVKELFSDYVSATDDRERLKCLMRAVDML